MFWSGGSTGKLITETARCLAVALLPVVTACEEKKEAVCIARWIWNNNLRLS